MKIDFIGHITENLQELLSSIVNDGSVSLFRRGPRVLAGFALDESSTDYHLYFLGHNRLQADNSVIRLKGSAGEIQVFKNPEPMQYSFLLAANGLLVQNRLRAYDRIVSYFFDHKTIQPFVPPELKKQPALYELLLKSPAEISVGVEPKTSAQGVNSLDGFRLNLEYRASYHTGTLLSEENKITQRVINYSSREKNNERSVT